MTRFKSARQCQRFVSIRGPIANLFHHPRNTITAAQHRDRRHAAMATWRDITLLAWPVETKPELATASIGLQSDEGGEFSSTRAMAERITKRFKSSRQLQRFVSNHDPIANLFHVPRHGIPRHECCRGYHRPD